MKANIYLVIAESTLFPPGYAGPSRALVRARCKQDATDIASARVMEEDVLPAWGSENARVYNVLDLPGRIIERW